MNRHYDRKKYLETVTLAKELMPDIALTTDIIVGFPTETQEDFEDTLSILREVGYDSIFSFIYSRREGTKAAEWENVSSEEEIDVRFSHFMALEIPTLGSWISIPLSRTSFINCFFLSSPAYVRYEAKNSRG